MDNFVSRLQESTAAAKKGKWKKKKKSNNKPIKVVYISNPIEVKTSASKFRALVQELTGQDAEYPHDPTKFTDSTDDEISGGNQKVPVALEKCTVDNQPSEEIPKVEEPPPPPPPPDHDHYGLMHFDNFDDVFTPQMLENFTGFV